MGINIKIARIRKGFNQDELCTLANISRCTLSKLEKGKLDPKRSLMLKLSHILDTSVDELFFNPSENLLM